jgi:hypothetical protein
MRTVLFISLFLCFECCFGQYEYEASKDFPFGRLNPEAPEAVGDYKDLIGRCNCSSVARGQDGTWADPIKMSWEFKYIMNGTAVQDQTLKADGVHSGSIRQYDSKAKKWLVHYYSASGAPNPLPTWEGGMKGPDIVLFREQKAPNGMDGFYRITFSDIHQSGFKWNGAWVSPDESVVYPLWKIDCTKQKEVD